MLTHSFDPVDDGLLDSIWRLGLNVRPSLLGLVFTLVDGVKDLLLSFDFNLSLLFPYLVGRRWTWRGSFLGRIGIGLHFFMIIFPLRIRFLRLFLLLFRRSDDTFDDIRSTGDHLSRVSDGRNEIGGDLTGGDEDVGKKETECAGCEE